MVTDRAWATAAATTDCSTASTAEPPTPSTENYRGIAVAGAVLAIASGLLSPGILSAGTPSDIVGSESTPVRLALKGGSPTRAYPATGLLMSRSCPSGRCGIYALCTGVLGGADRFFTAAHCLSDRRRDYWVFLQEAGIHAAVTDSATHFCDDRDACDDGLHDLASLRLVDPVGDIPLPRPGTKPGGTVRIVGFGDSGPARLDHGILRAATVTTTPCDAGLVCYRFGSDSAAACNHDSGGPMFQDGLLVALARRTEQGCVEGYGSYSDITVPSVRSWWNALTGHDSGSSPRPKTERPALAVDCVAPGCWNEPGTDGTRHPIHVHAGARRLIVTLNHALLAADSDCAGGLRNCSVGYELMLVDPGGETETARCHCRNDFVQVAACDCREPHPGRWTASIRVRGERGPYQMTGRVLY